MTPRSVSIVLPIHNQADHLADMVRQHVAALLAARLAHEVLLVPNACRDQSPAMCQALAEEIESVRVVESDRGGWGRAVRTGLAAAEGELVCYTNSARTTSEDLVLLISLAQAHPDLVVKANRRIREHWTRRLGSLLYNLECRLLFDLATWDINGTPKVFPRHHRPLIELQRDDDLIDAEFCARCRQHDYRVVEVPIFTTRRWGGRSTTGLRSAMHMYRGAIELWRGR